MRGGGRVGGTGCSVQGTAWAVVLSGERVAAPVGVGLGQRRRDWNLGGYRVSECP